MTRRLVILGALVVFAACAPGERRIREVEVASWQDGAWETTKKAVVLYDTFDRRASVTVIDEVEDIPLERLDYEYEGVARNPERVVKSEYRRDEWAPVEDRLVSVDNRDRIFHLTRRAYELGRWVERHHEDVTRRADGSPVWQEIYSTADRDAPRERIRHFYRDDGLAEARSSETIVDGTTISSTRDEYAYDDVGRRHRVDGSHWEDEDWRLVWVEEIDETDESVRTTTRYDVADGERTPVRLTIERYESGYELRSDLSSAISF